MRDEDKTKRQLITELEELRRQVATLEAGDPRGGESKSPRVPNGWWHALVAQTPLLVAVIDRDHRICFLNRTNFGMPPEALLGRTLYDFAFREHHDEVRAIVEQVFATGKSGSLQGRSTRPDGEERWYEGHFGPILQDGKVAAVSVVAIDITARKVAEQERDRLRTILTAAIECLPFEFFAIGPDGRYIFQNATLREHYGDAIGQRPEDFAPDEASRRLWLDNNRRAFAGERVEGEVETHIGGETRHIYNIITPIRDGDNLYGILGVNVDITERKRAGEALRSSEAKYRRLYDSMRDAFVSVTMDGRIQEYNEAYRQMLGYEPDELAALTFRDLTPDKWHAFQDKIIRKQVLVRGYSDIYDKEYRRKDGTVVPVELRTILLEDEKGQPCGMWAIIRDITERKQNEKALRESEGRYRVVAESTRDIIYILDGEGTLLFANRAASQCIGIGPDEIIGKRQGDLFPPEMARVHVERTGRVFATGEVLEEDEEIHFGSEQVWLRVHLLPLRDEAGQVTSVMGVCHNITERKRAEEALKRAHDELEQRVRERTAELALANEQLQTIYNGVIEGLLITDIETKRFVRANAAMCRMLGYSEEQLLALSIHEIHPPEELPDDLRRFEGVAEGRGSVNEERPTLRKDGSVFFADITGHPIVYNGRPCVLALFRDVTERKRAEEALRKSEESLRRSERRFRNYFEQGLIGMGVTSVDKRWLEVNDRLCEIRGYSREELLQRNWAELTHPDDLPAELPLFNRLLAGEIEHYTLDKRFIHKDKSIVYTTVHVRAFRKDDGSIDHIIALTEDITARKQAEQALRASEERFRVAFEESPLGMVIGVGDGTIVQVNGEICRMTGYSPEELIGRHVREFTHPEDRDLSAPLVKKLIAGDIPSFTLEKRYIAKGGRVFWAQATTAAIHGADGKIAFALGILEDINERKRAQEALERERRALEHLFRASDHERQLIAYDIHDGLAQYLAGAVMQLETYAHLKDTDANEAGRAFEAGITMLRQGYAEARRLISGVRPPILDEEGIVAAVAHLVHDQRVPGGPKIELQAAVEFGRLVAIQENAIYRIVQEALANACKHGKSERVRVALVQQGSGLRVEVQDWGVGFDPSRIGEQCFGLEGIRERVRLLGGQSTIESAPGKGTRIAVELPLVVREQVA